MSSPLAALGNLLAAQEVQEAGRERRRAVQLGCSMLDELDQIRASLLEGKASEAALGICRGCSGRGRSTTRTGRRAR